MHGKLAALAAVDGELRALEHALDDAAPLTELREPGISVCSRCGALHGSDARFCPSCGTPVHGPRAIAEVGEAVSLPAGEAAAAAPPRRRPRRAAQPPHAARCSRSRWRRRRAARAPRRARAAAPSSPPSPPRRRPPPARRRRAADRGHAPVDERARRPAADGEAEAVAQPTCERREP